jgi:xylulokinase
MLGAEAKVDYSLANRSLLFDLDAADWSDRLLKAAGLDRDKLPPTEPSGTLIGTVSKQAARETGLPVGAALVTGAHDQCANALGCGVTAEGSAMYGMGTYLCLVPTYRGRKNPDRMRALGLNTEHHGAPGRFVSFVYNQGGSMVKWFRDSLLFGSRLESTPEDVMDHAYDVLNAEMPAGPSAVLVLPHFSVTGPPHFLTDSSGLILEGATYYILETLERLPEAGISIDSLRAAGGGSVSDRWVQLTADIMHLPVQRPKVTQAGALGAAMMAGTSCGAFASMEEGAEAMVHLDREFLPDAGAHRAYRERFACYREMYPRFGEFLRRIV